LHSRQEEKKGDNLHVCLFCALPVVVAGLELPDRDRVSLGVVQLEQLVQSDEAVVILVDDRETLPLPRLHQVLDGLTARN